MVCSVLTQARSVIHRMRWKSLKLLVLCVTTLIILFLMQPNIEEAEIFGWEVNISRDLNHYIHSDSMTATIMPKDFCDSSSFIVIMCISRPGAFEARHIIRRTWGQKRSMTNHNVSLYFLMGQTTDLGVQKQIGEESVEFRDIVQEDFYDTYNNLSLKSAMMLKLFTHKCQKRATYLLKIDDDVYLNLPNLVGDLVSKNQSSNLLMGSVICGARPFRTPTDKWYAGPSYLYPLKVYPNYLSGGSYCMSRDVAEKLLSAALTTPVFHIEDVYLNGICAGKIHLTHTHNNRFTYHHLDNNICLLKSLITIHNDEFENMEKLHQKFLSSDVERKCQRESRIFFVSNWLREHVLMVNKNKRRWNFPC